MSQAQENLKIMFDAWDRANENARHWRNQVKCCQNGVTDEFREATRQKAAMAEAMRSAVCAAYSAALSEAVSRGVVRTYS